ncbi:alpha-mannosidase [bacterium]|nr:alpha-mannosidase [bacterium]
MKIHLIGNAHIDPVWLWRWSEGMQVVRATCQSVLELLDRYPNFKFSFSSVIFYKWLEENDPDMFAKIKKYVQEGRWEILGGWIVEPDCNIPCGESFVRHSLYGQLFFKSRFGKFAKVGYNPDSFGHNASIPQILAKSGMEFYVFMRPAPHEKELPSYIFNWKSKDGSAVLTYRIPRSYATGIGDLRQDLESFLREVNEKLEKAMFFFGKGDHGGGPTEENLKSLERLKNEFSNHTFIFSTTEEFFRDLKGEEYPTVEDELQYHSRGCYTSCSLIKKLNRQTECNLITSEKISAISSLLTKKEYPREKFQEAWETLLFCQFHDILAGSSIEPAYEDARNFLGSSLHTADKLANYAFQNIANRIKIERQAVIVFNPSSWQRKGVVEVELSWQDEALQFISPDGEIQEGQEIQSLSVTGMRRFLFLADVPPLGYKVYELLPAKKEYNPDYKLENEFFSLSLDENGYISHLLDKTANLEPLTYPALVPLVIEDPGDAWGHDINSFREVVGQFKAYEAKFIEAGPLRWKLRVKSRYGESELWQDFIVYKGLPFIDVEATLLWKEKRKMLKISLPTVMSKSTAFFSIPYGFIEREQNGEEQPLNQWMNIDDENKGYGVAFINDSKYGGDVLEGEMRLSIVRSPVYAHHIPRQLESGIDYHYMDQGYHRFSYRIYPHKGSWQDAGVVRVAEEFNNPLLSMIEHPHQGTLPPSFSLLEIKPLDVIISALKFAEEEDALILRLWETTGKRTKTLLIVNHPHTSWEGELAPTEIKTLKLDLNSLKFEETNLLEV